MAALNHTRRETGLDLDALNQCADYWEVVREFYAPFDTGPKSGSAEVYLHEMPGGQYTNLKEQAESMGLGARWHEIARTYAEVNLAFGAKTQPMTKDSNGIWTATIGAVQPEIYTYSFIVDGARVLDMSNPILENGRAPDASARSHSGERHRSPPSA